MDEIEAIAAVVMKNPRYKKMKAAILKRDRKPKTKSNGTFCYPMYGPAEAQGNKIVRPITGFMCKTTGGGPTDEEWDEILTGPAEPASKKG